MKKYICHTAEICPVYKNWVEHTKDKRIDVVQEINGKYSCLALDALSDFETGIPTGKDLKGRLNDKDAGCSLIKLLNFMEK